MFQLDTQDQERLGHRRATLRPYDVRRMKGLIILEDKAALPLSDASKKSEGNFTVGDRNTLKNDRKGTKHRRSVFHNRVQD